MNASKKGLDAHIVRNFKYPKEAAEKDLQGRVNVLFSIGTDGKVSIKSMSGGEKVLQEEAKRLIETLPQLIPGQHQGKNAAVMFLYPINFKLAK
ncbi:energy transducer TonB [Capnocytophaga canimorsus]|nr:energy transducer TonB [Capnocytophaga canimorsus]WGU69426.1 energy transducer TonB [Capnocytophaga canimorsus]WGU71452.1 energy transducer TonB [Capnocytophaga canimorsus]